MARLALCCALLCGAAAAEKETRLGGLIRWYLNEESPSRRQGFLEAIERLTDRDPYRVMEAIRKGEHFDHAARPHLKRGGKPAVFDARRPRIEDVSRCAGDFAALYLPAGYTPERAYALILELSPTGLYGQPPAVRAPKDAVVVVVNVFAHEQAVKQAGAAELLVMSLLAHLVDVVHVDPDRVFLYGGGSRSATLAFYIGLHNPDRFAGVLGVRGAWPKGIALASNVTFSVAGIEPYKGDRGLAAFLRALPGYPKRHLHLRAREQPVDTRTVLVPRILAWRKATVRPPAPRKLQIVSDRGTPVRSYWLRMVPRVPSRKPESVNRQWRHWVLARPATCEVEIGPDNLVTVKTYRVAAFDLFIDPALLDPARVLRVQINGRVPEARVIHLEIADVLEDYRERRDSRLLYACRLTFG